MGWLVMVGWVTPPSPDRQPPAPRPDPRVVARGLSVPERSRPYSGGTFEKPTVCVRRCPDGVWLVELLVGSVVAASVVVEPNTDRTNHAWLLQLHTLPAYRRHGLATAILQLVITAASRTKTLIVLVPSPFGTVGPSRARLIAFYERIGFRRGRCPSGLLLLRDPRPWMEPSS